VRRGLVSELPKLISVIDQESLRKDFLEMLKRLQTDEMESVRTDIFDAAVTMMGKVDLRSTEEHLLPLALECVKDKSWRVRSRVAQNFIKLQKYCPKHVVENHVISALESLVHDNESEIRVEMLKNLEDFCRGLDESSRKKIVREKVVPLLKDLATDPEESVKQSLASCLLNISPAVGKDITIDYLIPTAIKLLKDKDGSAQVRQNLVSSLGKVGAVVGLKSLNNSLIPPIIELSSDPKWHVRLEVLNQLPVLADILGVQFFNDRINKICLALLSDPVFDVREAMAKTLGALVGTFGTEWFFAQFLPPLVMIKEAMIKDRNYRRRMTVLHTLGHVATTAKPDFVVSHILPAITSMSTDKVANIRISVAITLQNLCAILNNAIVQSQVKPILEKLKEDADVDVCDFARDALQYVKT